MHESDSKDLPVSSTDGLTSTGEAGKNRDRKLAEFKATNTPLSANDIRRKRGKNWVARTTENIGDLEPQPEKSKEHG
jgi:hypothetical protein